VRDLGYARAAHTPKQGSGVGGKSATYAFITTQSVQLQPHGCVGK